MNALPATEPAAPPRGRPAPDGSVLSCFTGAIAQVIWREGRDWLDTLGETIALRIRPAGELFAFSHHQPSLRGLFPVPPERTGTDKVTEALDGIATQLRATGHVIVAGDAANLPWSTAFRQRHAPHWFVVDGRVDGGWHVTDPFRALDEHGKQRPWAGVIPDAAFPGTLRAADLTPEQALREQYAFGDRGPEPPAARYQYFTAAGRLGGGAARPAGGGDSAGGRGARAARGRGPPGPPEVVDPADGWLTGPAAVRALYQHFASTDGPGAFRQADDLWVVARHRELRHRALRQRLGSEDARVRAAAVAASAWAQVPMTMRFAAESARRGRRRTSALLAALGAAGQAEQNGQDTRAAVTGGSAPMGRKP